MHKAIYNFHYLSKYDSLNRTVTHSPLLRKEIAHTYKLMEKAMLILRKL